MKNEIALGIITGILLGSGLVAPQAAQRTPPQGPSVTKQQSSLELPKPADTGKPLSYYQKIDKRDLFKPAIEPAPPPPKTVLPRFPEAETVWIPPTEGWTYAGYFSMNGVITAIIQEPASGQAAFLREGDAFREGTVVYISTDRVEFSFDEGTEVLYKSREYNTVPLAGESAAVTMPHQAAGGPPRNAARPLPNGRARPTHGAEAPTTAESPLPDRTGVHERAARLRSEWAQRRRRLLEQRNTPQPQPLYQPAEEDQTADDQDAVMQDQDQSSETTSEAQEE